MSVLNSLLSPLSMVFTVMLLGCCIGRIRIFKVSLGLSGVLLVAVLAGWLLAVIKPMEFSADAADYQASMKLFSTFGTALFVSTIGIATGGILDLRKCKDMKAMLIGSLMVSSAFIAMKVISLLDRDISAWRLLGSLCGALTTTPGLSAACELKGAVSQEIVLGYGCTYLFGAVATVLFAQAATRKIHVIHVEETQSKNDRGSKAALSGLLYIGSVVLSGRLMGSVELFGFSLGASGGMLCAGIVVSCLLKSRFPDRAMSSGELKQFKSMGLVLFFAGNGIQAGMQLHGGFDIKAVFYGVLLTMIPIASGVLLDRALFKEGSSATVVAGGMTSTPAIGILAERDSNVCLSRYALAYLGALVTIVILIRSGFVGTA